MHQYCLLKLDKHLEKTGWVEVDRFSDIKLTKNLKKAENKAIWKYIERDTLRAVMIANIQSPLIICHFMFLSTNPKYQQYTVDIRRVHLNISYSVSNGMFVLSVSCVD